MKLFNESTYETKEAAGSSIHYENSINYPSFSHNITSPYSYPNVNKHSLSKNQSIIISFYNKYRKQILNNRSSVEMILL